MTGREMKPFLAWRDRLYEELKLARTRKNAAIFRKACESVASEKVTLERLKEAFLQIASAN